MRTRYKLMLFATSVIAGGNFVAAKIVVGELPPIFASGFRFLIVALLLLPFLRIQKGHMRAIILASLNLTFINFSLIYMGIAQAGDMSIVAVVSQMVVPISTIMAIVFLGEQVGWRRAGAIALTFAGVFVLGFDPRVFDYLTALALILSGVIFFSYGTIQIRKLAGVPAIQFLAWQAVVAAIGQLTLTAFVEDGQWQALMSISDAALTGLLYTAVLSTFTAHLGFFYVLQRNPVNEVMPFTLLAPVFGVLYSVWLLDEVLSGRMIVGGLITLAGVAIISFRNRAEIAAITADLVDGDNGTAKEAGHHK